jgi:hypothetical protein
MSSRKVSRIMFNESKVQKVFEELDKLEFCGLAFNQMIRVIRCYILNKLYYVFTNMDVPKFVLDSIDVRVRKLVNRFLKGRRFRKV